SLVAMVRFHGHDTTIEDSHLPTIPRRRRRALPHHVRTSASTLPRLALALLLLFPAGLRAQSSPLAGLDDYITAAMAEWEVPGLAIAIVRNDSVIHARGYGVREQGRPGAVD